MENYLLQYMNKRLPDDENLPYHRPSGPVITISREVGCGGLEISRLLAEELSKNGAYRPWQVISKEILTHSAMELKVAPEKIERLLKSAGFTSFEEVLAAMSDKYYKSNKRIIRQVRTVIRNFATNGYGIILGRAGHIIAADIKNALHVRLVAPYSWRVNKVMERFRCDEKIAAKKIEDGEIERSNFKRFFADAKGDERFDLCIDVSGFSPQSIAGLIAHAFEYKKLPQNINIPYF
ncbi:MAG: cytidylate kinase-like family protein [Bacteroidales bacterium]|jgi:cytidylate kinase|nr:cytidylate kinase-like family protein [Bacteroidales bacterium]